MELYNTDPVQHAQAIWAFALWGRTALYDLLDEIEDVDQKISIETQYLDLLYELPVAKLVDRLEQLHRAAPPEAPLPEVPNSTSDQRAHLPLESTRNAYDHSHALLGQVVDPEVLHWPKQQGVPVCELPDGRKALLIFHLFSGRRREGDCHYWAKRLIEQYFPDFEVIMLSIDTAVGGEHCWNRCTELHGQVWLRAIYQARPARHGVQLAISSHHLTPMNVGHDLSDRLNALGG